MMQKLKDWWKRVWIGNPDDPPMTEQEKIEAQMELERELWKLQDVNKQTKKKLTTADSTFFAPSLTPRQPWW